MVSKFLPAVSAKLLKQKQASGNLEDYYELLAEPLHEELYRRQTFDFIDELSEGQQLLLSYDYVLMQVSQGGFIQLIQNGYIGLLLPMPAWLNMVDAPGMAKLIDDVLKVYVLNKNILDKETSVEEFAMLYNELPEFEILDQRFEELNEQTIKKILAYASSHIEEFASIDN